jgi:hypothetical protein
MEYRPTYIIVHHSGVSSPDRQFASIDEAHKARGFPLSELGFHVGYHQVIERDGTVVSARIDLERDCDALGHNFDSLSVCLAGNFNKYWPTQAQKDALGEVLAEWCSHYSIDTKAIFPHRHFNKTDCYGLNLHDSWIQEVIAAHAAALANAEPSEEHCEQ